MTKEHAKKLVLDIFGKDAADDNDIVEFYMSVNDLAIEDMKAQASIEFANFIVDNSYTKDEQKGWYKYFTKREDFPQGFAMSTPVYEFLTIEDIYNLYLQQKTK